MNSTPGMIALSKVYDAINTIALLPKDQQPSFNEEELTKIVNKFDKDTLAKALSFFIFSDAAAYALSKANDMKISSMEDAPPYEQN